MVTRMQTYFKNQMIKLAGAFLLMVVLMLSLRIHTGRAGLQYQTIPTMPPTTAIIPTTLPSDTPTSPPQPTVNPPQPTVISSQATYVIPSQTAGGTASATVGAVTFTPSSVPSATGLPGGGTIPQLTATLAPTEVTGISPTPTLIPTEAPGTSGVPYGFIFGGMVLGLAVGLVWWLRSRRRGQDGRNPA